MSVSANFHGAETASAHIFGGSEWLQIECKDGSRVCIPMPHAVAKAMADTFNAAVAVDDAEVAS